jgi:hypothetical protein
MNCQGCLAGPIGQIKCINNQYGITDFIAVAVCAVRGSEIGGLQMQHGQLFHPHAAAMA